MSKGHELHLPDASQQMKGWRRFQNQEANTESIHWGRIGKCSLIAATALAAGAIAAYGVAGFDRAQSDQPDAFQPAQPIPPGVSPNALTAPADRRQ